MTQGFLLAINKDPVIRATLFFSLPRNIVALQVKTLLRVLPRFDQLVPQQNTIASFRLDNENEIEYEYDFSTLVFRLHIITTHTNSSHELLSLPKNNMKKEGSGIVTGLKFESRTRTQPRTRSQI